MRGRKPKLAIVEGGKVAGRVPSPPSSLDEHGKAEWKRVAPGLYERGHLDDGSAATLEAYCRSVSLTRTYAAMLDAEGHVIDSGTGPKSHPAFKQMMATMREQRLFAAELGLTPHRRKGNAGEDGNKDADGWRGLLA